MEIWGHVDIEIWGYAMEIWGHVAMERLVMLLLKYGVMLLLKHGSCVMEIWLGCFYGILFFFNLAILNSVFFPSAIVILPRW